MNEFKTMEATDVLVVGAGPAGCALGLLLCQAGEEVLIAEAQDVHAKDKLCGGVLNAQATELFGDIYGAEALAELGPHCTEQMVSRFLDTSLTVPCHFDVVPRARFDAFCHSRYVQAGGRSIDKMRLLSVEQDKHVATFRNGRTGDQVQIGYRTLVGADGALSAVRRATCGRPQRTTLALQGLVALPDEMSLSEVISDQRVGEYGTCWFIPQGNAAVVGALFHNVDSSYTRTRLDGFCADLGIELSGLRGALIPAGDDVLFEAGNDIWLVGDAAGLIDADTGAGLHHAFYSARALAESLLGGQPYKQAMAPTAEYVQSKAAEGEGHNLLACLRIAMASKQTSGSD